MLGYNRVAVSTDVIGTKRGTGMEIENTVFCGHVLSLFVQGTQGQSGPPGPPGTAGSLVSKQRN